MDDGERQLSTGRLVDRTHASVLRHLYVRILAAVCVHTLVPSMDVHAGLCFCALMLACFTFIYILAESGAEQLVPFRAHAGELPRLIDTLVLAQVAGVAALINIIACKAIRPQLIALITAAQEGAICVVTPLRAGGTHITFIHINAGSVISCQLETRLTLTGEGSGHIDAAMLAVPVPALIDVDALCADLAVPVRTLAGKGTQRVDALLTGLAVMLVSLALIYVHTAVSLRLVSQGAGIGHSGRDGGFWGWDD